MADGEKVNKFDTARIKLIKSYVEDNFDVDDFAASFSAKHSSAAARKPPKSAPRKTGAGGEFPSSKEFLSSKEFPSSEAAAEVPAAKESFVPAGITPEERMALEQPVVFERSKKERFKDKFFVLLMAAIITALCVFVFYQIYLLVDYNFFDGA